VDANFTNLNTDKYQEGSAIGAVTPAAGTFTTLTATGTSSFGTGSAAYWSAIGGSAPNLRSTAGGTIDIGGSNNLSIRTNTTVEQFRVTNTASAVNYVQVTGAATTASPTIDAAGSDATLALTLRGKGSNGSVILGTTFGTSFRSVGFSGATVVNYLQAQGAATTVSPVFSVQGSDTNISQVFQSKGTGAIDLAAGSSGVNISNGGTVTAITGTASGSAYTSIPSVVITAPTTAGGVQATATAAVFQNTTTLNGGGTGYSVNDVLSFTGGTFSAAITVTVTSVSAGVITGFSIGNSGTYTVLPTNPISVTGGTGSGATFNVTAWSVRTTNFTITNAGSGYVEQPTVTFSGGGGSGAAAFASVGAATTIRSLGGSGNSAPSISFATPSGEAFRVATSTTGGTSANYLQAASGSTGNGVWLSSLGSDSNVWMTLATKGTGNFQFLTNLGQEQMRVAHTASAVNYLQVTGNATTGTPIISGQGSDTNVNLGFVSKGSGEIRFASNASGSNINFRVLHTTSSAVNYGTVTGAAVGSGPVFSVAGSDTNIDLTLTPKGTGNVRFGTYTGTILTPTGYVEIKDSGGTVRRLLVG
jgi:hypothetical protein